MWRSATIYVNEDFTLTHIWTFLKSVIFLGRGSIIIKLIVSVTQVYNITHGGIQMITRLFLLLLLTTSSFAFASEKSENPCQNTAFTLWTNSSHPGGNKSHKLNEDNDGLGFKCFFNKTSSTFFHLDALENSRHGSTLSVGLGMQFSVFEIGALKAYAGGTLSPTYYEVKDPGKRSRVEFLVIPSVHYGIGFELPRNYGTISFEEKILFGRIRLRSLGWQYKF